MKQHTILIALTVLACSLLALPSHAEPKSKRSIKNTKTTKSSTSDSTSPKKVKNYDFMADDIDGSRIRPDGTSIFGLQTVEHKSLIRLRSEFIAEIVKSAEML